MIPEFSDDAAAAAWFERTNLDEIMAEMEIATDVRFSNELTVRVEEDE